MTTQSSHSRVWRIIVNSLAVIGALSIGVYIIAAVMLLEPVWESYAQTPDTIELVAKPWNDGKVHLWHDLTDGPDASYTDVREGTECTKVVGAKVAMGSGSNALYYYQVRCNGLEGFVAIDQVR